ncbi:MAG: sodium:proton antiporter [Caulobacteraceae bacterium]|nr:sodium:proton antiporter [Caulobacter sp.]
MLTFEFLLLLLAGAVLLSGLAKRLNVPYPTLLALAGAALALSPVHVPLTVDPNLVLALFLAPVLLDAAYDASPRDLKANWLPLTGLVFIAVGLTTASVAWVARLLLPDLPWPAAIALGAIVSPPDAAAATAVLRPLKLPHRIVVVLEGESLLNDASTLLIYNLALAALAADTGVWAQALKPAFALSIVGSVILGPLLALLSPLLIQRIDSAPASIVIQFVTTFGVWILAERLGLSPVLTVVFYAMTVSRTSPGRMGARMRVPSYAVWETAVLVLNALGFVIIGLQLRPILSAMRSSAVEEYALFAGAVLTACIVTRLGWIALYNASIRLKNRMLGARLPDGYKPPTTKGGLVVGWAGMRGLVTLATALALPAGFPHRDLVLFTAFFVAVGTLTIQGLTLRPLLLMLRMPQDTVVDGEVRRARVAIAKAGRDAIDGEDGPEADMLRAELLARCQAANDAEDGEGRPDLPGQTLRRRSLRAARRRLLQLRKEGDIGDDAFHRVEEELDFADLAVRQEE